MKKCETHANAYGTTSASPTHHHFRFTIAAATIAQPSNVPAQCNTRVAASLCARTYCGQNSPKLPAVLISSPFAPNSSTFSARR